MNLGAESLELTVEAIEPGGENVVAEHRGDRDGERRRRRHERLGHARCDRAQIARAPRGDPDERVDDAEHGAEEADERAHRADRREPRDVAPRAVALRGAFGLEDEAQRLHLRAAERRGGRITQRAGLQLGEEVHGAGEHAGERVGLGAGA